MKWLLLTSLVLIVGLFTFQSAFASDIPDNAQIIEIQSGKDYTDTAYYDPANPSTILHLWESHNPRLVDGSGHYDTPYYVYDNGDSYTISSGQGTYVYDKNT